MSRPVSTTPMFGVPRYHQGRPNTAFIARHRTRRPRRLRIT